MIIGRALGNLFDGMKINVNGKNVVVQNNYGNQDSLNKFIAESNKRRELKFPLVFYVTAPTEVLNNKRFVVTDLIIMMNTKEYFLYKERTDKTYIDYIEPIYREVIKRLSLAPNVTCVARTLREKFKYVDLPNYGIRSGATVSNPRNNVGGVSQGDSIVTEYVDARIVNLNLKIDTNCLIK